MGGKLVASGTYDEIRANPKSLTGRYLSGDLQIQMPQQRRAGEQARAAADRRARAQPEGRGRDHSAEHAGGHHGRLRLRQEHAGT